MGKTVIFAATASLVVIVLSALAFVINSSGLMAHASSNRKEVHVIEHSINNVVLQLNPNKQDPRGDELVFANPVFDAANKTQVGHDNGDCVRTSAAAWECFWTTFLPGGQVTVEGPFNQNGSDSTDAITGGTGTYSGAHGQMLLHARNQAGTEYDFIFTFNS